MQTQSYRTKTVFSGVRNKVSDILQRRLYFSLDFNKKGTFVTKGIKIKPSLWT